MASARPPDRASIKLAGIRVRITPSGGSEITLITMIRMVDPVAGLR